MTSINDVSWLDLLCQTSYDTYHLPGYLQACTENEGGDIKVVIIRHDGMTLGVPLLIRSLPFGEKGFDACSPYGYPCAIASKGSEGDWDVLWKMFCQYLRGINVLSIFLRFNPLLTSGECLNAAKMIGNVVSEGETVYVDLQQNEEFLWLQTREPFRRAIKKLINSGWKFVADDWTFLQSFIEMYNSTMQRNGASNFYFFPDNYFTSLRDLLGKNISLHSVLDPDGNHVSAGLYLSNGKIVQYHLGGTHSDYLNMAPSKLLYHGSCRWYKNKGAHTLHFGGGLGGKQDGLFTFKAGFSKNRAMYHTCRIILDKHQYERLTAKNLGMSKGTITTSSSYFPLYRAASIT